VRARIRTSRGGFTLIELLIVMAIIIVLAGLILATSGYVQNKGKRSRAEAEIAAMSAALESYKADNGIYPTSSATEALAPNADPAGGNPASFADAARFLYIALSGDSDGNPTTVSSDSKNYLGGALKPGLLSPNPPGADTFLRDPFSPPRNFPLPHLPYGYSTIKAAVPGGTDGYNPTFDLWTTAGEVGKKPEETFSQYQQRWIKNW
jgi:prepilin-type N-terminal cleavage/methylation domain-containing protein